MGKDRHGKGPIRGRVPVPPNEVARQPYVRTRAYEHLATCGAMTVDAEGRRHVCAQRTDHRERSWCLTADGYAWDAENPESNVWLKGTP